MADGYHLWSALAIINLIILLLLHDEDIVVDVRIRVRVGIRVGLG